MNSLHPTSGAVRVVTIGIGGASCSGKTTLAKHLRKCLPGSFIVHQDDFAPPQELIPYHPEYNVQDWDDAPGAIEWPRMASVLTAIKRTGEIPAEHYSHDHLNEQVEVPVGEDVLGALRDRFEGIQKGFEEKGEKVVWVIVDGFLLYWDKNIIDLLDVRILVRAKEPVLKERRHQRHGYHTAVQSDPEGTIWRDPPQYWEQIVYPAYQRSHAHVFTNGDVEEGDLSGEVGRLILLEGEEITMRGMVETTCEAVGKAVAE